jgi:hypothetical protein
MAILKARQLLRLTSTYVTSVTHGRPTVLDNITCRGERGPKVQRDSVEAFASNFLGGLLNETPR